MVYRITNISDDGGCWGRAPKAAFATADEAVASAIEFIDAAIDDGDYGQTDLNSVKVDVRFTVAQFDEEDDEIDDNTHRHTAYAGEDKEVSGAARDLYARLEDRRHPLHIDASEAAAANELVGVRAAHWVSYAMSEDGADLKIGPAPQRRS